jgi:hypothetical protein
MFGQAFAEGDGILLNQRADGGDLHQGFRNRSDVSLRQFAMFGRAASMRRKWHIGLFEGLWRRQAKT